MITHLDIGYNGRLGNQLFIYALLFKLKKLGKEVIIPNKNYQWKNDGCLDQYHQKWIPYKYVLEDYFDLSIKGSNEIPNGVWAEPKTGFHKDVLNLDNIGLTGYFQSWKYFDDIKLELKNELKFKNSITDKVDNIFKNFNSRTICIHIRLGDTLAQPWMHKMSPDYIQKCLGYLPEDDYKFVIVSDNFEYIKDWFPDDDSVYFAEGLNEAETIYLMSLCNHYIMSGSTFSWWGAYLGQKEDSIVMFPNYFDGSDRDLSLFYHPSWKLIDVYI